MTIGFKQAEGVLLAAARDVESAHEDVRARCSAMDSAIASLSGWEGAGAMAFQTLNVTWQAKQREINQALRLLGEALATTHRETQAVDEAAAQLTRSFTARLGA